MKLKVIYKILILLIISLGIYYNSLYGDFFNIDDTATFEMVKSNSFRIKDLFIPSQDEIFGYVYYRPFFIFSFYGDYLFWGDEPFGYHLHNIIVHAINTIFSYLFFLLLIESYTTINNEYRVLSIDEETQNSTLNQVQGKTQNSSNLAFFAALLFSLHPLQTEAVNWISARSDLYATFFLLLASLSYLLNSKISNTLTISNNDRRKDLRKTLFLLLSGFSYLLSLFSKENTLFFPLIVWGFEKMKSDKDNPHKDIFIYFSPFLLIYLFLRYSSLRSGGVSFVASFSVLQRHLFQPLIQLDIHSVSLYILNISIHLLSSLGFYYKKLIYPFPLNFAIYKIDEEFYGVIGCLITVALTFSLRKKG
ncbi:MAG: hypothetical protein AABZ11_00900, partial [Nitrospinota bacterium]